MDLRRTPEGSREPFNLPIGDEHRFWHALVLFDDAKRWRARGLGEVVASNLRVIFGGESGTIERDAIHPPTVQRWKRSSSSVAGILKIDPLSYPACKSRGKLEGLVNRIKPSLMLEK